MLEEEKTITQEELDDWLFNDLNSKDPIIDLEGFLIIHYKNETYIKLEKTEGNPAKGTFGEVFIYQCDTIQYAVKFSINISEDGKLIDGNEILSINTLRFHPEINNKKCNIIPARIVQCVNKLASIMPRMNGDIHRLNIKFFSIDRKKELLESIREQLNCIINLNDRKDILNPLQNTMKFAYLDLKPSNVLYKIEKNGKFVYKLGDIGSIIEHDNENSPGEFSSTYTIQLNNADQGKFPGKKIVRCMRYIFGLFSWFILDWTNYMNNMWCFTKHVSIHILVDINYRLVRNFGPTYSNLIYDESSDLKTEI
jgi:hypothetical protein